MNQDKIKLTEKQKKCVSFQPQGALLVRGIPGSGKSTIILARAQYLLTNYPNESLVILTFSRTLSNYVKQLARKTIDKPVEALTFHNWAQTLLKETNFPHTRLILGEKRKEVIQFAKNIINKHKPDASFPNMQAHKNENKALVNFLSDEIEWIKGSDIKNRDEYLKKARVGRGANIRVTKKNRDTIYDVLEKYNELLEKHPKHQGVDSEDLARILFEKANSIPDSLKPDHILIDEAQDLYSMQLRAISALAKKSLTIGADKGQQIYRRSFTWKEVGIAVAGNRSRFLDETFRSTKQIVELANDFQEKDTYFTKDDEYMKAKIPNTIGKVPQVSFCNSKKEEQNLVLEYVEKIRTSFPEDTIGVIANKKSELTEYKEIFESKNIPVYNLNEEGSTDIISPGVKLITFYSSKGLEFDHVIVTGLKKGKLPYKTSGLLEDEIEFISRERKKFYVAMTRAKKTLLISAVKPYSPFIDDLNSNLYELYKK